MYIEYFSVNGNEYARLRTSIRRNGSVVHGKSTSLGRVIDKERMIFKNRTDGFYQYDAENNVKNPVPEDFYVKESRKNAQEKLIVDFGDIYFIDEFVKKLNLWSVFESVDYGNMDTFKALLLYYVIERKSNAYAENWYDGSYVKVLYSKAMMSSQRISDILKRIGMESVYRKFFSAYISYLKHESEEKCDGSILIDSTGIPNNAQLPVTAISNHNGEINNEVRLIYVVQRGTGLPIYMRYVPGNVVDISTLLTTISELKALKVDTKFAILDAGYLTLDSINHLLDKKISFLARAKKKWKFYSSLIKENISSLESSENLHVYNGRFIYLKRVPYKINQDHTIYCYIGIDDARRAHERSQLAKIAEDENLQPDELKRRMEQMGVFMLISSRRIATKDLLPLYYSRLDIEQVFDIAKGYAKALPLRVQTVETFRGHLLMVFMATVILRLLQQKLVNTKYSLDDVLAIMRNQKAKIFDSLVIPSEATKKQNDLYKMIKVRPELSIPRTVQA